MQNDERERETPLFEAFGKSVSFLKVERRLKKKCWFSRSREAKDVEEEQERDAIASSLSRRRRRAGSNGFTL